MFKLKLILISVLISNTIVAQSIEYPKAGKVVESDVYFGKTIEDPYRWLEDLESEETKTWINDQKALTKVYQSQLTKSTRIQEALEEYNWSGKLDYVSVKYSKESQKNSGQNKKTYQYRIYTQLYDEYKEALLLYDSDKEGTGRLILDPRDLRNYKGEIISVESYYRSPNEKYLAILISRSGSDWREIHIFDFEQRKRLPEVIKNVKFSGVAWIDDKNFYYIDHSSISNQLKDVAKDRSLKLHRLLTSPGDDPLIYKSLVDNKNFHFELDEERKRLFIYDIVTVKDKTYNTISYKYTHPDSLQLPKVFLSIPFEAKTSIEVLSVKDNQVHLYTNYKAKNYYILKQDINQINQAKVLIPQREDPMIATYDLGKHLLCLYLNKGYQYCIVYDWDGKAKVKFPFPEGSTAGRFREDIQEADYIYYELTSFIHDRVTYKMDLKKNSAEPMFTLGVDYKFNNLVTKVVYYTSKDGTEVPMYITHKKDIKLDGTNPTVLYAYGGFGLPMTPFYSPANIILFESGGVLAVPTIRGGGELGSDWHEEGSGLNKQNSFDDFIYAAKYLIQEKYTSPSKLAIRGASNGGLLVAAVMCQTPELFGAVVAESGVYDMLRFQKFTAGVFWVNEYGSVYDEAQFNNLLSYSPLHNLKEGVHYPSVLVSTGATDDRVTPLHSYKFLATLQEKGDRANPYYLQIDEQTGHSSPEIFKRWLESESFVLQFIFDRLGSKIKFY